MSHQPNDDGIIRPNAQQTAMMKEQLDRMKQEEEQRPELFSKVFECNDILHSAYAVRQEANNGRSISEIRKAHPAFAAQFPVIFEKCCTPDFPLTLLPVLLDKMRSLKEDLLSKEEATDQVCHALNSKFVDPVLRDLHLNKEKK